jgi:hypothetical protein
MSNLVKTNVEGFLDGYKARNLAANKITSDFHIEEIIRLVDKLKEQINPIENTAIQTLDSGKKYLAENITTEDPKAYYNNSISFGESLKSFMDLNNNLLPQNSDILKKTIYHYLNLAKKLEDDDRITKLAREIANEFIHQEA